jgi:hypothetical protein
MKSVFIGGCGRSGTTLLGAMLGAHSECICTPESQFKVDVFECLTSTEKPVIDISTALNMIRNHWRFKIWGLSLRANPPQEVTSYPELIKWVVKMFGQGVGKPNPDIWIDHTPGNRKYVDILFDLFPESKMIHIVRDGRAVAASIMPLDWGASTIDRAAHFWQSKVTQGLAAETFSKDRVARVKYEELVQEPEKTLRKLCVFIGIDYQPAMIEGKGFKVPHYTQKHHSLIGRKPDSERVKAWETSLTDRQVEIFESIAGKLLSDLGYSLRYEFGAEKVTKIERIMLDAENHLRDFLNKYRKKIRRHKIKLQKKNADTY